MFEHVMQNTLMPHADVPEPYHAVLCCAAGSYLSAWWAKQWLYDPGTRPWKSSGLATMLEEHHLFWANRAANEPNTFTLCLGQLITEGAKVC
jgi:hypothetical protein